MMDNNQYLSPTTRRLHWIVGIGMICLTALGIYMEEFHAEQLFDIHISLGVVILVAVIPRLIWRYKNGWPVAAQHHNNFERISGKIVHWLLLLATALMPLSGIMMAIAGGYGLHLFGIELVAETLDPSNLEEALPLSPSLAQLGEAIHGLGGILLPLAIVLHIVGALKHHYIDKDETLRRMLGMPPR